MALVGVEACEIRKRAVGHRLGVLLPSAAMMPLMALTCHLLTTLAVTPARANRRVTQQASLVFLSTAGNGGVFLFG